MEPDSGECRCQSARAAGGLTLQCTARLRPRGLASLESPDLKAVPILG